MRLKNLILFLLILILLFASSACTPDEENGGNDENPALITDIVMRAGDREFTIALSSTEAAKEFVKLLPLSVDMRDVNSNEKYYVLPDSLPVSSSRFDTIYEGDIMLWGANGLVVFYKTFVSGYNYTSLGKIKNTNGFRAALGDAGVSVTFDIKKAA